MSANCSGGRNNESSSQSLFSDVDNDAFKRRQNDLFNVLLQTEKETIKKDSFLAVSNKETSMSEKIKLHRNIRHHNQQHNEPKAARKSERAVFKKPENRCSTVFRKPHTNKTPDFIANPHKWTKYSLASVTESDMSERSNTNAALSFLNDLKKRRSVENDSVNVDCSELVPDGENKIEKILFKKKTTKSTESSDHSTSSDDNKEQFVGTKCVMPEYIIGQKLKKVKNADVAKIQEKKHNKEIALNHLFEEEEDDC